ncbi:MAG: hypothetical protein E6J43_01685 [Chloroflexi bacterium]|nr:MAG: hypothetical protein E6J43_01685 [Chloroflexota bacterium]
MTGEIVSEQGGWNKEAGLIDADFRLLDLIAFHRKRVLSECGTLKAGKFLVVFKMIVLATVAEGQASGRRELIAYCHLRGIGLEIEVGSGTAYKRSGQGV